MKPNNFVSLYTKRYIIGTHDGSFSADEVLACAIITLSEDYAVDIIRTENIEKLKQADFLINVTELKNSQNSYLSSSSVWEAFNKKVYSKLIRRHLNEFTYHPYVENFPFISSFIPPWNSSDFDKYFVDAVQVTSIILEATILQEFGFYIAKENIDYRILSNGDIPHEESYYSNGILTLSNERQPWLETIIAHNNSEENSVDFVIFPDSTGWTAKCVPISLDDETPRIHFPDKWIGLSSTELSELTHVEGVISCDNVSAKAKTKDAIYFLCFKAFISSLNHIKLP